MIRASTEGTHLQVAALTARGRVRKTNEDAVLIDNKRIADATVWSGSLSLNKDHLLAVADGMGGHAKGEVASRRALELLSAEWSRVRAAFAPLEVVRDINRAIYQESLASPEMRGMGTTLVGIHVKDGTVNWFSVGDSRIYLCRRNRLQQLSTDHVPHGATMPDKKRKSHAVTQSLGGAYSVLEVWPSLGTLKLVPDDLILICTDGVSDSLSDQGLATSLGAGGAADHIVESLASAVEEYGSPDNYSLVVAIVG